MSENGIIELKDGRYFHAIYFASCDNGDKGGDWLAAIYRDPDGPWHMTYRFRWYRDKKAFDSEDVKNVFEARAPDATEKSLKDMSRAIDELLYQGAIVGMFTKPYTLDLRTDDQTIIAEAIMNAPFAHVKRVPAPRKH